MAYVLTSVAFAQTGNIKGKVEDLQTGEPLPFANVVVIGTARGAVTDDKGNYFVSGVPPGTYTIRVSLLGYQNIELKKSIEAQQTLVLDFRLASSDIPIEGVTVVGEAPLVNVMKTGGDQSFGRDKIEQLPNVKDIKDIAPLQAGVVSFGGQLFLRGGRASETQILIDGVPVNDVGGRIGTAGTSTANEQLAQLYTGNVTAGVGGALSVSANAIQSVTITAGGTDVEYGNAQSGHINIITREGGETYNASAQYRTDALTNASFDERYYAVSVGGPEPITTNLLPLLGLKAGKTTFFMSGTFTQSDGPYDFNTSQFYNPARRRIKVGGIFGDILNFTYSDKQQNDFTFNTKITHALTENDQLSYSYRANLKSSHPLSGSYGWKNMYDSSTVNLSTITQNVLQWSHIIGANALLKSHISRLETKRTTSVGGLPPYSYSNIIRSSDRDPSRDGFYDLGTDQGWSRANLVTWNLKVDFSSKVHPYHFLKAGVDYYYEEYRSTAISLPLAEVRDSKLIALSFRGDYPGVGAYRWVTNVYPSNGALYVQDNIELASINIHVGLRYDFFYLGKQVADPAFVRRYEELINTGKPAGTPYEYASWVDYNADRTSFKERSFLKQFMSGKVSPRLAIGYPISERTVFYFNYGHYLQWPERQPLYRDAVNTGLSGNYVGNPALKSEKTIKYEAGFDQLIFDDLSLGVRGFYKDVIDLISFRDEPAADRYINLDYASSRGFEIILSKQYRDHYSGSLTYTFQLAKGRASDPFKYHIDPRLFGLPREVRLDWDQEHTLNLFLSYRVGPNEKYDIFGVPFDNWGASITWSFGSGFPYTPIDPGIRAGTLLDFYLNNTATGPFSSEVNMSFFKGFTLLDKLNLVFTLDITNLLNRRNVDVSSLGFNRFTGRPYVYGDYVPTGEKIIYSWGPTSGGDSFDARVPPFVFKRPRQLSLGVKLSWD